MMEEQNYFAILPNHVRRCKEISANAKLLYSDITALTKQCGYCYASNKYLAELYDVDESTIKRWLKELVNNDFIEIESKKTGFKWERKIFLKEFVRRGKNEPSKEQNCTDREGKNEPIISKEKEKEERMNEEESFVRSCEEFFEEEPELPACFDGLQLSPQDQRLFAERYVMDPGRMEDAINAFRQRGISGDAGAFLNKAWSHGWKANKSSADIEQDNRDWTERQIRPFNNKTSRGVTVQIQIDCVGFVSAGAGADHFFDFTDREFKQKVTNMMRKLQQRP